MSFDVCIIADDQGRAADDGVVSEFRHGFGLVLTGGNQRL